MALAPCGEQTCRERSGRTKPLESISERLELPEALLRLDAAQALLQLTDPSQGGQHGIIVAPLKDERFEAPQAAEG